jgi:predicted DNA-binding transcriptional regulator YafY
VLETSARLLRLLALLQGRRFWSGAELAEELGVTDRTLRRDVDRLRDLGYAVEAVSGRGGGYQLGHTASMPPLLLGEEEAVTLAVALRTAVESVEGLDDRVLGVLVKLDQLLPERLRARVAALHSQTVSLGSPYRRIDASLLATLAAACRDSDAVRMRYRTFRGEASERVVYPLRLVHTGSHRWYLVAWEATNGGWRTLRVDRIEAVLGVGPRVMRPAPPDDLEAYVSESITSAPYPCRARVELDGTPDELRGRVPPWIGVLQPSGPRTCVLDIGAGSWDGVAGQLVGIGLPFRAVDPPELVERLRDVGRRLTGAE